MCGGKEKYAEEGDEEQTREGEGVGVSGNEDGTTEHKVEEAETKGAPA